MRFHVSAFVFAVLLCVPLAGADTRSPLANLAIDMEGFLRVSREAAQHRATRRVTEDEFLSMSREPDTVVLDARSREKYVELHVKGAVNLSFPDIAVESLARTIPDKATRILILQQQLRQRGRPVPDQGAERVAQSFHLHRALQLRLPQRLRARAIDRCRQIQVAVRIIPGTVARPARITLKIRVLYH